MIQDLDQKTLHKSRFRIRPRLAGGWGFMEVSC